MNRNAELYNTCILLLQVSRLVKSFDEKFANEILNKVQEYKDQIVPIDYDTEMEIKDYADRIREDE